MFTQHDKISFIALSTALYCMSHDVNDSIRVLHEPLSLALTISYFSPHSYHHRANIIL